MIPRTVNFVVSSQPQALNALAVQDQIMINYPGIECQFTCLDLFYGQNAEKEFVNRNIPYWQLPNSFGSQNYWVQNSLSRILTSLASKASIRHFFQEHPADLIVIGNDTGPLEKLIIHHHKSHYTAKSLLIQDGILNQEIYFDQVHQCFSQLRSFLQKWLYGVSNDFYGLGECDYLALLGPESADFLSSISSKPLSYLITGSPRFDDHAKNNTETIFQYPSERKTRVVFFSQPLQKYGFWNENDWTRIQRFLEEANTLDDVELFIKLHPSDDKSYYPLTERQSHRLQFLEEYSSASTLEFCDIAVVYKSTIAVEALFYRKMIIALDPWGNNDCYKIPQNRGAFRAKDPDIFLGLLKKYLRREINGSEIAFEDNLKRLAYRADGKASYRIAAYINDILNDGSLDSVGI